MIDGFTSHFVDQTARNRAADQAAEYQTERGGSHTQSGSTNQAEFVFKVRTPCACGTVSAGQGNRAGNQADKRIQIQNLRQADADKVLHDDKRPYDGGENHQRQTACFQAGEIRAQTDRSEENQHECVLQRFFKFEAHVVSLMQCKQDNRSNQAACHRLGNVEIAQEFDFVYQNLTNQQNQCGGNQRVVTVKFPFHNRFTSQNLKNVFLKSAVRN